MLLAIVMAVVVVVFSVVVNGLALLLPIQALVTEPDARGRRSA